MVQAKKKKPQPKRKPQHGAVKKQGKQGDAAQFRSQLDALGLKIVQVTADGNCFFRALADQLEGNELEHQKYRHMVMQYIVNHREEFEPFIEDEVPFDEYCQSMEKDGTWAGHMELQATSLVTRRNICIHHILSPRWYIRNFNGPEASMIHLSYHDREHYNSVRLQEDSCEGPAKPIIIKMDANISATNLDKNVKNCQPKVACHRYALDTGLVKLVMAGSGCVNLGKVEQVLHDIDGDVDAAIDFLMAEQDMTKDGNFSSDHSESKSYNGTNQTTDSGQLEPASQNMACVQNFPSNDFKSITANNTQDDDKRIAKNKMCPCGSKKKYKSCCGSTVGRSSATTMSENKWVSNKDRKERRKDQKKEAIREVPEGGSSNVPDLGALCI